MQSMSKYFFSILFVLCAFHATAQEPATEPETEESEEQKVKIIDSTHQLRLGFDVARLVFNNMQKPLEKRTAYELELDYYWKKDLYIVVEGGWGNSSVNYSDLAFESNNVFFRGGINKSLLPRLKQDDWDMAFIGLRYGIGLINRGPATYTITDNVWGSVSNTVGPTNMTAHWMELTGGVRVELFRNMFIGWNIRGKFMINGKQFKELPPYNIAGYGKGEKGSIFDFNLYLSYAMRWQRKNIVLPK